jgi:hypothetical protein
MDIFLLPLLLSLTGFAALAITMLLDTPPWWVENALLIESQISIEDIFSIYIVLFSLFMSSIVIFSAYRRAMDNENALPHAGFFRYLILIISLFAFPFVAIYAIFIRAFKLNFSPDIGYDLGSLIVNIIRSEYLFCAVALIVLSLSIIIWIRVLKSLIDWWRAKRANRLRGSEND